MTIVNRITFKMSYDGVPCEIELGTEDPASPVTFDDAKKAIEYAKTIGFAAPVQWKTPGSKEEIVGKIGTVEKVEAADAGDERKGFNVIIRLDDNGTEVSVKTWVKSAFRKGDRVKINKNDKGYMGAELHDDTPSPNKLPF